MEIAYGFCHCTCGQKTPIAKRSRTSLGHVKGQPLPYVPGHTSFHRGQRYAIEERGYATPCWIWRMCIQKNGYGYVRVNSKHRMAHVHAWERIHGPVPKKHHVHHMCEVPLCVNPDHLELLTPKQHYAKHHSNRTHCMRGHEFTEANTYRTKAGRYCRACKAMRSRVFGYNKYWEHRDKKTT